MRMATFWKQYRSLLLLFFPAVLFGCGLMLWRRHPNFVVGADFPYFPWQLYVIAFCGTIATTGGVLDWRYHRDPLRLQLSKKEREAEAAALGLGGVPMFILMWLATISPKPSNYLIPILVVLIYTIVAICYDEFVFHIRRCGPTETLYHRLLVFGNGFAWLAWMHFIYCR
jgi:hypothetical protein